MSRSGALSDLANLVNEVRSNSGGSSVGNGSNGSNRSPPHHGEDSLGSLRSGGGGGGGVGGGGGGSRYTNSDSASISSFSRSMARVARAAESKDAASIRSGASRSMASRSYLPSNLNASSNSNNRFDSNESVASFGGSSQRSHMTDSDRTNTTARLMSLVQELSQGSRPSDEEVEEERRRNDELEREVDMLRNTLQPEIYVNSSNNDDVSTIISVEDSAFPQSFAPSAAGGASAAPSARSGHSSHISGQSSHISGQSSHMSPPPYPMPYIRQGSQGMRHGDDPSIASRSAYGSYVSNQYSHGGISNASTGTGSQDPAGYVMPRGMGVLPDGTVFTQSSSSMYSGSGYSQASSHEPSMMSGSVSRAPSVPNGSVASDGHSMISGRDTIGSGQPSMAGSMPGSRSAGSNMSGSRPSSVPGSSQSAPGGFGSDFYGDKSVMSNSYVSQPLPSAASMSQGVQSMPNYQQVVPHYGGDDLSHLGDGTFGSRNSRSIAGSAALIPKAKFSWASESLGTQSTVMTQRSLNSSSVPEANEPRKSQVTEGRLWASFAWMITFPIPNKCIMRPTKDAKQAWREKVALFLIMVSCSVFFVGVFGFVPLLLCKEDSIFSMQDIWLQTGENWVVVHGVIYDVKDLIYRHPGGVDGIIDFLGKDASKIFPRAPPVLLPDKCLDMEKVEGYGLNVPGPENNFTNPTCASFSDLDVLLGITCHTFAAGSNGTAKFLGDYARGVLTHTTAALNSEGYRWIAIYDRVYDVSTYVNGIQQNQEPTLDGEEPSLNTNPAAYLTPTLNKVIMNSLNSDATDLYEALFGSTEYIACLEEIFYIGLLDDSLDTFCATLNIMMYVMLIFVASLMVVQFLASMVYICPRHRTYSEEDVMSPVMVMVPCYNEGDNELRKTIKSVLNTTYPDENKVLFMVGDGLVTGNGEDMSTPEHLANILGFDIDEFEDDTFEYNCIGVTHTKNRARVYHGILQKGHKFLKYIAVIKCGLPAEATSSAKPGNRGKRDSQLVTMGYFNRIHYGRELTELDSAVQRAMVDLNLQADMVRFLMAIDADTRVDEMSVTHMVYGMDKKERVLALCGETKVDNKASSWVTMIQVFEYYNSHHLKKAFEAAFGCVTCLPGCFTMYRIIADDGTPLLPGDGVLYDYSRNDVETLHEKNLYHLGEDRMLTTLLLKHYPDRSLTFIPEAACWTIVPHTFKILLSQRRRWINSTVHNMFELLKVNTMCGVCCVSMKVVVAIDLIATMILPASYCYAMYLIFLVFFEDLPVSTILLILYAIIMGVQVVVFILRSRWDYCWWFFVYFTVGLPVFYLILPTYSFWNMDDFSWGKTRSVGGSAAANAASGGDDDEEEKEVDVEKPLLGGDDDRSTTSSSSSSSSRPSVDRSDYSRSEHSGSDGGSDDESEGSESRSESEYSADDDSGSESSGSRERSYRSSPRY